MRTSDLAKHFGVHPNTIRLYEEWGYLPPIPRDASGERQFTQQHIEQMRLARCALHDAPGSGPQFKNAYKELVWLTSADQLHLALTRAGKLLSGMKEAYERACHALVFLQGLLPDSIAQLSPFSIQHAAAYMGISVPLLRRWEAYGLIEIPRNPTNSYRVYGPNEIGWLFVVQSLRHAGYKIAACKRLITLYQASKSPIEPHHELCDVISASISLFREHETHMSKVLDQLHRMAVSIDPFS